MVFPTNSRVPHGRQRRTDKSTSQYQLFSDDAGRRVGRTRLPLIPGTSHSASVFGDCGVGDIDKVKCASGRTCGAREETTCLVPANGEPFFCETASEKLLFESTETACLVSLRVATLCCGTAADELLFVSKETCDDGGTKTDLARLDSTDFGSFRFSTPNGMKGSGACFCRTEGLENGALFGAISFDPVCLRTSSNDIFVESCKS